MAGNQGKGGGARKYDRNRKWCEAYQKRGQREKNKLVKLLRHIARYGATDHVAVGCFNGLVPDAQHLSRQKTWHKRIAPALAMPPVRPRLVRETA